jgi:hypothetical protein
MLNTSCATSDKETSGISNFNPLDTGESYNNIQPNMNTIDLVQKLCYDSLMKFPKSNFDSLLDYCLNFQKKSLDSISNEELILLTRLANTITYYQLGGSSESSKIFSAQFNSYFLPAIINRLEFSLSKGMQFYSKKYDLYIGGSDTNSHYILN